MIFSFFIRDNRGKIRASENVRCYGRNTYRQSGEGEEGLKRFCSVSGKNYMETVWLYASRMSFEYLPRLRDVLE